jgi:hypothetical protein
MATGQHAVADDKGRPARTIIVEVNNREVALQDHKATGMEIKEVAIAQGVPIAPDFLLFELKGGGTMKQVEDDEEVTLHPHQRFSAVAPDDNS